MSIKTKNIGITLKTADTTNIYFISTSTDGVDDIGTIKIVDGKLVTLPRHPKCDYKLMMRVSAKVDGKIKYKKKITRFDKTTTLNDAVKQMNDGRDDLVNAITEIKVAKKDAPITLKNEFDNYIALKDGIRSKDTLKSYRTFFDKWLDKKIGHMHPSEVTTVMLQSIIVGMLKRHKHKGKWHDAVAPRTALTLKQTLNPLYKKLMANGTVDRNPVTLVEIPKFDNTVHVDISDEQTKALLKAIDEYPIDPYRGIFVWMTSGRRLNEVLSLKWENIDDDTYTIIADNNKVRRAMKYTIRQNMRDALPPRSTGYVFPSVNNPNMKMSHSTITRHWKAILKTANIDHLRIHDIRHIIGGTLVNNGASLEQIASVLGHSSTAVTKRYSKVRTTVADEALDTFFDRVQS